MIIPAIDAGTGRFKVAIPDAAGNPQLLLNRWGEPYTPAVLFFPRDRSIVIGTEAVNAAFAEPQRAVFNWKRSMGTDKVLYRAEDGTEYRARDILCLLLKDAKANVEERTRQAVTEVVVSVPANYNDPQKQETIEAVERAGMKVLCLVHEPTAAALGNEVHKRGASRCAVYDLGQGTFDVSVLEMRGNLSQVIATNGEPQLGCQDFTDRIKAQALKRFEAENSFLPTLEQHPLFFQDLESRAEQLKVALSVKEEASLVVSCDGHLLNIRISRQEFESWVPDLVEKSIERAKRTLTDANLSPDQIDVALAVGGGSLMPIVRRELEKALGKKLTQHCEPHYAAALGGVLAGRLEYARQGRTYVHNNYALPAPDIHMRDVTSHPLGVCVVADNQRLVCQEILAKGAPIPSIQTRAFRLVVPNQTEALIEVLQGENEAAREKCVLLGHFTLSGLPPKQELTERIEVVLKLDGNGILTATARDRESGQTRELEIDYGNRTGGKSPSQT